MLDTPILLAFLLLLSVGDDLGRDRPGLEIGILHLVDLDAGEPLDGQQQRAFLGRDERPGDARLARPGRAADAVDVDLGVLGQVVVDDVADAVDVEPAGGEVRRHEHAQLVAAELGHDPVPLGLVHVAVDCVRVDALAADVLAQGVNRVLGPAEDQGEGRVLVGEQVDEQPLLVPGLDREVVLGDLGHGEAGRARRDHDLLRIVHVLAGEPLDLGRDRRRDEDRLVVVADRPQDLSDVVAKADVEHAVDLVEDRDLHVVIGQQAPAVHVHDPARRAHDERRPLLETLGLDADPLAPVDAGDPEVREAGELAEIAADLDGQLPRGGEDQAAEGLPWVEQLQHRQPERRSLACARPGLAQQVAALERRRDELDLGVGRALEAQLVHGLEQRLGKPHFLEARDRLGLR